MATGLHTGLKTGKLVLISGKVNNIFFSPKVHNRYGAIPACNSVSTGDNIIFFSPKCP
jgi:hypothetical protein